MSTLTDAKLDELEQELRQHLPNERSELWMKEVFELARKAVRYRTALEHVRLVLLSQPIGWETVQANGIAEILRDG